MVGGMASATTTAMVASSHANGRPVLPRLAIILRAKDSTANTQPTMPATMNWWPLSRSGAPQPLRLTFLVSITFVSYMVEEHACDCVSYVKAHRWCRSSRRKQPQQHLKLYLCRSTSTRDRSRTWTLGFLDRNNRAVDMLSDGSTGRREKHTEHWGMRKAKASSAA
jgi:hypothetical protein